VGWVRARSETQNKRVGQSGKEIGGKGGGLTKKKRQITQKKNAGAVAFLHLLPFHDAWGYVGAGGVDRLVWGGQSNLAGATGTGPSTMTDLLKLNFLGSSKRNLHGGGCVD